MFNFLASQIPWPIFCTPASLGHVSVTGMSIGNLQYILLHDIHNLLCDLILKHESTSPEFVWGFQCSLLGSKIHYLGQEKSNSLHGSTQVVNIHYLGQNISFLFPFCILSLFGCSLIFHSYNIQSGNICNICDKLLFTRVTIISCLS